MLVDALNANLASAGGAITWVEEAAWRWIAEFVGYPAGCGVFTSGGTVANLSALAIARERAVPGAREHGVAPGSVAVYCSAEAHHSVDRACDLLGLGRSAVRRLAVDEALRLRPDALAAALAADRAAGVTPLAIWASAGTTNTGAVDPLAAIAEVAERHGVWLHVDGAWGAPAAAARATAALFDGMARADSLSIDPHKWLYVPKDCGCLLVRDPAVLEQTFAEDAAYLENVGDGPLWGPWSLFRGIEYSRPARGAKLWAAFVAHGADAFVEAIERDLANARAVADAVRAAPDLELLDEPQLSAVVFRHVPRGVEGAALEAHNRALLDAVQRDGRCFPSGTTVRGAFAIRPCFTSHRTTREDALAVVDVVRELGALLQ
jgi:aromatic-L-amino-acid/L-tryptophan decarboxylase